jgi:hypothetical protein
MHGWSLPTFQSDAAKNLMAKFKNLRRVLKAWQRHISSLSTNIENVKSVLSLMEILEEHRDLTVEEWNFKNLLRKKLTSLLHQQKIYWNKVPSSGLSLGCRDKFFRANASIRHRKKLITCLKTSDGTEIYNHEAKAEMLWNAYKDRLGTSNPVQMPQQLEDLMNIAENLDLLDIPFSHEEIDIVVKS